MAAARRRKDVDPGKRVAAAKKRGKAKVGRTIDAAAATVPKRGGRKPGLTAAQKATRDTAIIARRSQGWTQARVGEHFGVSVRSVQEIEKAYRSTPSGMDTAPMQLVEDLLRQLRAMVGDFEDLSAVYADAHPGVALQAKRQARETLADLVALERMLGLLPTNLGLFRAEADLRFLGETVLDQLARLEAGEIAVGEVAAFVREEVMQEALRDLRARN